MTDMAHDQADKPGVIARPPFIYLGALLLGLALDFAWPSAVLPGVLQYPIGGVIILAGIALMAAAMRRFAAAGTNVPTTLPATALVTGGIYRFSRNPIYVALSLIYAGLAVAADSLWALALLAPVLVMIRYGVIAREERYLQAKFGDAYRRYQASVRRWI